MKQVYSTEEKIAYFQELIELELARKLVSNARFNKRLKQLENILEKLQAEKTSKGGKES